MFSRNREPISVIYSDLLGVMTEPGEAPKTSQEELLRLLSLDGTESDGKTLGQRMITGDADLLTVMQLRACISDIDHLLSTLPDHTYPTPYAHRRTMAENLMGIATAQIRREGPACSIVTALTVRALQVDQTLVPLDVTLSIVDQLQRSSVMRQERVERNTGFSPRIRRMPPFGFNG